MTDEQRPSPDAGLAWPPHHGEPPIDVVDRPSRARDEDRVTRAPMQLWDRVKLLVFLSLAFLALCWAAMSDNPLLPFSEALRQTQRGAWWLIALAGLELVRQIHYLMAEHDVAWHQRSQRMVQGKDRRLGRVGDWNRYRMKRLFRWVLMLVVLALVLGKLTHTAPILAVFQFPGKLVAALPMVFQVALIMLVAVGQFAAIFWFLSKGGVETYYPDDVKTRFSDVWGQDAVRDRVTEALVFLEDPEAIEGRGGYVPGGILLWGPPGTGKTLMAEAMAGETGKPYVFVDPGAFKAMFMGVDIMKVKSLFRRLRKLALRFGGVVCFIDEADALGNRGQGTPGFGGAAGAAGAVGASAAPAWADSSCHGFGYLDEQTRWMLARQAMGGGDPQPGERRGFVMPGMGGGGALQTLLTEMSGLKKPRGFVNRYVRRLLGMRPKAPPKYRILMMMATNMPEALDEALLRPGRLDRIYKVGYPSKAGRVRTYEGYFAKVPNEITAEQIDRLATMTPYATGATIKDLVNEALIHAIRAGRETIVWEDVIQAKHLKALGPPEDVEYVERERHATAVHESCHAVAAYRVRQHLRIDLATIEKGGNYLGMVASIPPEELFTRWRSEYEADIIVALASLAGERLFFGGDNSSGVASDLESATLVAALMEGYWGMGDTVSSHKVSIDLHTGGGNRPIPGEKGKDPDLLSGALGMRIEGRLARLLADAELLLIENRAAVLAVAFALETKKTLAGEDVEAIIDGRPGPLVDGRPYHDSRFQEQLEAYHREAVVAHDRHARPLIPMPALPPSGDGTWVLMRPGDFDAAATPPPWPVNPASAPAPVEPPTGAFPSAADPGPAVVADAPTAPVDDRAFAPAPAPDPAADGAGGRPPEADPGS